MKHPLRKGIKYDDHIQNDNNNFKLKHICSISHLFIFSQINIKTDLKILSQSTLHLLQMCHKTFELT